MDAKTFSEMLAGRSTRKVGVYGEIRRIGVAKDRVGAADNDCGGRHAVLLSACNASIQHGAGGKEYPHMKVKDVRKKIPYLQLMAHRQEHDTGVAKYNADCGSGNIAGQFSSAFGITTGESAQGLPVDLSASVMQNIGSCQRQAAALAIDSQAIDHDGNIRRKKVKVASFMSV